MGNPQFPVGLETSSSSFFLVFLLPSSSSSIFFFSSLLIFSSISGASDDNGDNDDDGSAAAGAPCPSDDGGVFSTLLLQFLPSEGDGDGADGLLLVTVTLSFLLLHVPRVGDVDAVGVLPLVVVPSC